MQRAVMLSITAAAIGWAANAVADSPFLKGAYGVTGSEFCLVTPAPPPPTNGFTPNLVVQTPPPAYISETVQGTITFNGDGTGALAASGMGFILGPTSFGFSDTLSFSFKYAVSRDGGVATTALSDITGKFTAGPLTGATFTIANAPNFKGQISQNGSTLTLATLTPTVETQTFFPAVQAPLSRICQRTGVGLNRAAPLFSGISP